MDWLTAIFIGLDLLFALPLPPTNPPVVTYPAPTITRPAVDPCLAPDTEWLRVTCAREAAERDADERVVLPPSQG